jgi:LysM repeat protein
LGCHRKHSRNRIARRLPIIAAPAVAGLAAAVCIAPQALADSSVPGTAHTAATADAANRLGPSSAQLLTAIERALQNQNQAAQRQASQPSSYTVKAGDSLSSIAGHAYHNTNAWPVLYWANRGKIHYANVIEPGQVLKIPVKPTKIPGAPSTVGPASAAVTDTATPSAAPAYAQSSAVASSGAENGSFGQCVIARESGGNAQVMNSSGHYGLYQFSASTWAAYGGSPADFGNASVSEQNAVFNNAIAQGGQSNWSAYDGC